MGVGDGKKESENLEYKAQGRAWILEFSSSGSKKSWGWKKLNLVAGLFGGPLGGNLFAGLRTRVKITAPTSSPAHHPANKFTCDNHNHGENLKLSRNTFCF